MARKPTDQEVADFLSLFRERPGEDQQASPVWQELIQFPQWGLAEYQPQKPAVTPDPPDPRMPPAERAEVLRKQGVVTDTPKPGQKPTNVGAMTTASTSKAPNPWAEYNPPPKSGRAFFGVKTDVPPPWPGEWQRAAEGWFRSE